MIERILKYTIQLGKDFLKSNERFRTVLYDSNNKKDFSDIYIHERMIADKTRINSYHDAIKRYIKPGDIVVDLGTGTGILSFMSAQQNPEKIYAIDHSDFINVSRKIAKYNNINNITFVQINSRDFKPTEKSDIILHEQLGNALFDENMIENILDLKKRILKKKEKYYQANLNCFSSQFA
jgi:type I protein arginine methyltransferase